LSGSGYSSCTITNVFALIRSVDQCWSQKEALIDPKEHADAVATYEHARQVYRERLAG
jgi:hypothetical protein